MTRTALSFTGRLLAAAILVSSLPAAALAQTSPAAGQAAVPVEAGTRAPAEQVREQFNELLKRHPPALGRVLKLDPALMANEAYMAPYPEVATFLRLHPEVARNPAYFLERIAITTTAGYTSERAQERREFYSMLSGFSAFLVFLVVAGVVVWLIRTVIEQRRWGRLSRIQAEVHTKLMDRFSSNDELLTYVQTPPGRRFLESGPSPLPEVGPALSAPFTRILWSVQAGVVLSMAGAGLLFVSNQLTEEPSQFFLVVGIVTLAVGLGFVASAGAAYALSRRLGLFSTGPATADHA